MRLRSIPPRTMGTLTAARNDSPTPGRIIQIRRDALTLQERLRELAASEGRDVARGDVSGLRLGSVNRAPGARQAHAVGGHGRVYRSPQARPRPVDLLIAPQPTSGRPASHAMAETAEAYVVRVDFPAPVRPEEIHWELHGDVLEVDYLGRAFTYYHAFLVPPDVEPNVEQDSQSLTFCFPRRA